MSLNRSRWLITLVSAAGAALVILSFVLRHVPVLSGCLFWVGLGNLLARFVLRAIFWRCPHCKERLPWNDAWVFGVAYCSYCGKQLAPARVPGPGEAAAA